MKRILNALSVLIPIVLVLVSLSIYGQFSLINREIKTRYNAGQQTLTGTVVESKGREGIYSKYKIQFENGVKEIKFAEYETFQPNIIDGSEVEFFYYNESDIYYLLSVFDAYAYIISGFILMSAGATLEVIAFQKGKAKEVDKF